MKYINNSDFEELGYVYELNRIVLHPLGLDMVLDSDNNLKIIDQRDKKEGVIHQNIDEELVGRVEVLEDDYNNRCLYRINKYGWRIQPLNTTE